MARLPVATWDGASPAAAVLSVPDADRLYNKGFWGTRRPGGALELTLAEAASLVASERLRVVGAKDQEPYTLAELVARAATLEEDFETRFLALFDLRARGFVVRPGERRRGRGIAFDCWERGAALPKAKPTRLVVVVAERSSFQVDDVLAWLADPLLLALVDEEGEVTYYDVAKEDPRGSVRVPRVPRGHAPWRAAALGDQVFVADPSARRLHEEAGFGRILMQGLWLSYSEAVWLGEAGWIDRDQPLAARAAVRERDWPLVAPVYADLRARDLVPRTGFKFGTHLRAYEKDPDASHARYLVHCVGRDHGSDWATVSRMVRLAHGVRKQALLAVVAAGDRPVRYLSLARVRP